MDFTGGIPEMVDLINLRYWYCKFLKVLSKLIFKAFMTYDNKSVLSVWVLTVVKFVH